MVRLGMVGGQKQLSFLHLILSLAFTTSTSTEPLEKIHFLIPAEAGGAGTALLKELERNYLNQYLSNGSVNPGIHIGKDSGR